MDPIHGSIGITELENRVLKSSEFQRLRYIRQLGNTHFVFPSAVHNRFSHSIGTMHLASKIFVALFRDHMDNEEVITLQKYFRLAALTHDIGHGPFSHLFEKISLNKWGKCKKFEEDHLLIDKIYQDKEILSKDLNHEFLSYLIIRSLFDNLNIDDYKGIEICQILNPAYKLSGNLHSCLNSVCEIIGSSKVHSLVKCLNACINGPFDVDRFDYRGFTGP
jgi:HD superfamily phosphohydrolase